MVSTSSLDKIGGRSKITVQLLKSRLISLSNDVMSREAIHSEEFCVGTSQGRTSTCSFLMRACTSELCKASRPRENSKCRDHSVQSKVICDLWLLQIKVDQEH